MSLEIPEHYIRSFEKIWNTAIQQEVSRLRDTVTVREFEGKELVLTDLDSVAFTERTGRLTQATLQEVTAAKRKITKREFKCQYIFDRSDKELLGMLSTPESELIAEMKMAWNREVDSRIVEAASATVYGGAEPYTTEITLPATQQVAVDFVTSGSAANSGLTPEKILEAKRIFQDNELDPEMEDCYLAMSPTDELQLMTLIKASGNEVWATMLNQFQTTGKLFGLKVKRITQLAHNTSTDVETALVWSKRKGIIVAPEKMSIHIDKRPDLDHAIQISAYAQYGFARRYEKGVVEIACDHSPA